MTVLESVETILYHHIKCLALWDEMGRVNGEVLIRKGRLGVNGTSVVYTAVFYYAKFRNMIQVLCLPLSSYLEGG